MTEVPILPAATVLLLRDRPALQVLMVERHHKIDFASGALVFPGGKASGEDADARWRAHVDCPDGLTDVEHGLRITAIREAYEESGILLARPRDRRGEGKPFAPVEHIMRIEPRRDAISKGKASFLEAVLEADLVLALDSLTTFAHWITPTGVPKRFDTLFFSAVAPEDQREACDGHEAVDAVWIEPETALQHAREGRRTIIFPTRLNLDLLARSETAKSAMEAAAVRPLVPVLPEMRKGPEGMMLHIPAEAGYGITSEKVDEGF